MKSFADLFRGREDAYGWYGSIVGAKPDARGKITGRAATRRGETTLAMYEEHLEGKTTLGIVPVMKDGTCWWSCIDVDYYQEEGLCADLAQRIEETGLPLVMTRSKSGGPRLWCFYSEPVRAEVARQGMVNFSRKLKLPDEKVDFFPAQDRVKDVGNWIILPYFGDTCWGLGSDGESHLSLDEFLSYADNRVVHPADIGVKSKEKTVSRKSGAPPCIDHAIENGVPEGYRSNFMTHYAIYAMKAFPDDWKEKVHAFNEEHLDEPMSRHELSPTIKSVGGKMYTGYLCKKVEALFCDKRECRLRQFGISGGGADLEGELVIDRIEKIDGEEPVYRISMDGKRFQCNVEQLFNYNIFRKVAFGALDRFLPAVKQPEWETFMHDRLALMEVEEAAADTQMKERVIKIFQRFCQNPVTESLAIATERRLPFYDGKDILFRGDEFMQIADRQLNKVPRSHVYAIMRDYGCVMVARDGIELWCWVSDGRPLWFTPYKGEQK